MKKLSININEKNKMVSLRFNYEETTPDHAKGILDLIHYCIGSMLCEKDHTEEQIKKSYIDQFDKLTEEQIKLLEKVLKRVHIKKELCQTEQK